MAETEYTAVTWTTGDVITEAKLDNMVANDQAVNAHAQGVRFDERADPADADVDASELHVYAKALGDVSHLYSKAGDDDLVRWFQPRSSKQLTDGATITIDWEDASVQYVTLGGNRTLVFNNPVEGGTYILVLIQDATGSRTVTWPAGIKWVDGSAPTLSTAASAVDAIGFVYVNSTWYGVATALNLS